MRCEAKGCSGVGVWGAQMCLLPPILPSSLPLGTGAEEQAADTDADAAAALEQQQSSVKRQKCSFALAIERSPKRSESTHCPLFTSPPPSAHPMQGPRTYSFRPGHRQMQMQMGKKRFDDHVDGGGWAVAGCSDEWAVGQGGQMAGAGAKRISNRKVVLHSFGAGKRRQVTNQRIRFSTSE